MSNPRYDQFALGQDRNTVVQTLDNAFAKISGVGHHHKEGASGATDEGNGAPIELDSIDQAYAGGANSGTLWQIVSWIFKALVAITGKSNIWTAPMKSIEQIMGNFESDGVTVKAATFDTRFPLSGNVTSTISVSGSSYFGLQSIKRTILNGKKLYLKRASYNFFTSDLRLTVEVSTGASWSSSSNTGDDSLNTSLITGDGTAVLIVIKATNSNSAARNLYNSDGWMIDLDIND